MFNPITALFQSLIMFLAERFSLKAVSFAYTAALYGLFIALFVGFINGYVSTYTSVIAGIGQTAPDIVSGVWGWIMPDNFPTLMLAIMTTSIVKFTSSLFMKLVKIKLDMYQFRG